MNAVLSFNILSALGVSVEGRRIAVGGPRQRTVLAMLLLSPERVVSVESLIEAVWNGHPPATGRTQIAICVARLRKTFREAGCVDDVIVTASPGYMLLGSAHRIDFAEFTAHVAEAARDVARGRISEAADTLGAALELWRGPALAGIPSDLLERQAVWLEEQRLSAYEQRMALRLELGQHRNVINELAVLVSQHPLREQARAQLMLAQYRAGRRAESLETFREARDRSVEEIGMEPGPSLRQLRDAILHDDPALALLPTAKAFDAPAQLPQDVSEFVGRNTELSALDELLADSPGRQVTVGFVSGGAGTGKTALALRWAHRVADRFPHGQLFADLHGYADRADPADPNAVLAGFLRVLGVPDERIPEPVHERAALYRGLCEGRRMLVVLDNVRTFAQIQPLLPGTGECRVLVTGRAPLGELLGGYAPVHVRPGRLTDAQAEALLRATVGPDRLAADPAGTQQLIRLCDRLPLALRIAGVRLAGKPHWTVGNLVRRLADSLRRLDELEESGLGVRSSLEPSYRALSPNAAWMYRALSTGPEPEFTASAAAALLGIGVGAAEQLAEELVDAQLFDVPPQGVGGPIRYRFGDLPRLHAAEQRARVDPFGRQQLEPVTFERMMARWPELPDDELRLFVPLARNGTKTDQ
ncbi:MAG TPA: BTAD domain-containing putative transcriptional regulator [Pseudonocardiaceae bacterium]|nr:BTAD domain-containing putative transcriptional regulator [Pseudonocardiaceae bacterium]